jgi:hypothetical protein
MLFYAPFGITDMMVVPLFSTFMRRMVFVMVAVMFSHKGRLRWVVGGW